MAADRAVLERQDVWTLSNEDEWHPTISWYERGITELKKITDSANPRSWIHLANIHGTFTPRREWPAGIDETRWNACQHGSWFFLPWHRIYLHHFEKIVRGAIVGLGGPSDWSLPFWDYDPERPETLKLPPAFRAQTTPSSGAGGSRPNALFVSRRRAAMNAGGSLDEDDVQTSGWVARFTSGSPTVTSFGGPKTGWAHMGPAFGQLEGEPHGLVHVAVGGSDGNPQTGGFMSFFELAGRDPIFWLHHANIDRLWEVWRDVPHRNTAARKWLKQTFSFGSGQWATTMSVESVLDTTAAPLSYRYEGVDVARRQVAASRLAAQPPAAAGEGPTEDEAAEDVTPELVAASDTGIPLKERKTIRVRRQPARTRALAGREGRRVHLALENVTATELAAGKYVVHVNVPEGSDPLEHKELRAGRISTFGLSQRASGDDEHGAGATFTFDITGIVRTLKERDDWDADDVRVTVTPRGKDASAAEGELRIGRVSVYTE